MADEARAVLGIEVLDSDQVRAADPRARASQGPPSPRRHRRGIRRPSASRTKPCRPREQAMAQTLREHQFPSMSADYLPSMMKNGRTGHRP